MTQMLIEVNDKAIQEGEKERVCDTSIELEHDEWYSDIIYYLCNLTTPPSLPNHKKWALRLKATKYCSTQEWLGWMSPNGILLRCVRKNQLTWLNNSMQDFAVGIMLLGPLCIRY